MTPPDRFALGAVLALAVLSVAIIAWAGMQR